MESETFIFMPNGDVTLTLIRNVMEEVDPPLNTPALQQAPFHEHPEPTLEVEAEAVDETEETVMLFAPDPPDSENFYPPPRRAARGSDASSRRDRSTSPPASFWASLNRQAAIIGDVIEHEQFLTPSKPARKPEIVSSHEVHCVVSSRHMMLASRFFEMLLNGNSKEAATLRSQRQVSIPLSADVDAIIILLNIVHGFSRKVPRYVGLEALSNLAILVSNFGMLDAVQFFSDTWIDSLQREGLPESYNENVLRLLFVFWVFDRPVEFKDMARLAQWECDENLRENVGDIPIPDTIIDVIKRNREFAIESAIAIIHTLINKYLDGQTICSGTSDEELRYACDATILGSLMKSSRKIGIWPKPEAPFSGRTFKILARAIRSIKILDVCKKTSSRRLHLLGPSSNSHGLEDLIEKSMKSIEASMDGLVLSEFAKKSDEYDSGLLMLPSIPSNDRVDEQRNNENKQSSIALQDEGKEAPGQDRKVVRRESSVPGANLSTLDDFQDLNEPRENGVKLAAKQNSRDPHRQEIPAFTFTSVDILETKLPTACGEREVNSRFSRNQDFNTPATPSAKAIDELSKEDVKVLGDRKLNRTTSFPMIPRTEGKSPLEKPHMIPRETSIEEEVTEELITQPEEDVKPTVVEVKASPIDTLATTENEEEVILPQNFKVRKSKKRFSAKY